MIQRDDEDPNNVATIWLVDAEGFLRGVYHAAVEDDIKDAVEDIALAEKGNGRRGLRPRTIGRGALAKCT